MRLVVTLKGAFVAHTTIRPELVLSKFHSLKGELVVLSIIR